MLLVDGHNLIGRAPGLSLGNEEGAREAVLRRLSAFRGQRRAAVVAVFDGPGPGAAKEAAFGAVRVVYAGADGSADDEILNRLDRGNPRGATVVTSDRRLAAAARARGARVESCEAFLARLAPPPGPPAPPEKPDPGAGEVEEWLRAFQGSRPGSHKI